MATNQDMLASVNSTAMQVNGTISLLYPESYPNCAPDTPSVYAQCVAEVMWSRASRLRSLIFVHLSIRHVYKCIRAKEKRTSTNSVCAVARLLFSLQEPKAGHMGTGLVDC